MASGTRGLETHARRRRHPGHGQDAQLRSAFARSVEDGKARLQRTWPGLLATGVVGGADLAVGVAAMALVVAETGSPVLGALAFTIGFIALTLAQSELFTENFLVPVAAVVSHQASVMSLLRLWGGTFVMNLVGGWLVTWLIVVGFPRTHEALVEFGRHYPEMGLGREAFATGILGGVVITLMTWMERNSGSDFGRLIAAVAASFLLALGPLNHVIVSSVEMFAALHVGAPFGYADWVGAMAWATVANLIGGLLFVTVLRFIQVGSTDIVQQRRQGGDIAEEGDGA